MKIQKRDGQLQEFEGEKIAQAIRKAFRSTNTEIEEAVLQEIIADITEGAISNEQLLSVEVVQDLVEEELMQHQYYKEAKSYILYRQKRNESRQVLHDLVQAVQQEELGTVLADIQQTYREEVYDLRNLLMKFHSFLKEDMRRDERLRMLIKASVELISKEAPKWEYIASRFLSYELHEEISARMQKLELSRFSNKLKYLEEQGYYGDYIRKAYSDAEIDELGAYLKDERDALFTYSGLELVKKRYLMCSHSHEVLETPQEMFMGIAMHLAMPEKERVYWAKQIYDILSQLQVTMATPTMSNARKPYHQLSSCFIDTVEDTLNNIYKSIDNFAQVSKYGGGMGLYFGKVRANGSDIRGFEGAAGGVIRWIKLVNDTATAVDQLGVRQGAVAVYLDAWHKDLPEFLNLRTNNGDDRMKAHDVFPAVCYPDLFWKMAKEDLNATWYLMCPHEIHKIKGYHLEDFYGEEWEERYFDCVQDPRVPKRAMVLKDLVRLILKSAVETGTPFTFNRDHVNRMNPNSHAGMIYCSNLCTEIAQNMKALELEESRIVEVNGETIVVNESKSGDFVVCNLASLSLGNIDVNKDEELSHIIHVIVRALDNVIDLNYYPIPYAKITNRKYRPIGLGVSGYHHMLVKQGLRFESEEHLQFTDALFEKINYYAIQASSELAKEKGSYQEFTGSDWQSGAYFTKRSYVSDSWKQLEALVQKQGMRNAWLMAIAPTSSTSIIAGTTAGVDPIMNKYFLEEKKGSMIARVAPDLDAKTFWLYKNAHLIDQEWVVRAAGIRQRHIDQAQSVNLYITNEFTLRQVLMLYIHAWEYGVKTIYYVRSKSLEVEECESCAS
ncbi:ribonucleoside-diphosphate reductase subunit alpha [[Clostridium] innocuum]|uniref:ribonucleoside-diphosphate reductase subunit alpha n=1 Tax=Clostridium innocuum TaxID=1522 RepID=UPI001E50176A|nr:ribonucleoside-diphosphate reductase subunit alpha [[Clostridium] innocuum]MCC2832208.1 ribonucleoside-diphosphate reductase subunit alpha [[Clostridium] innocuum]